MHTLKVFGALAAAVTIGATSVIIVYPQSADAQTQGMNRRGERRDTRQTSRDVKHQCNATAGNSRSDCRQAKRSTKQAGRHD
jgi:Flp pilus assembly protein TadB